MKLTELLINQRLIVQLVWGEQLIEFDSEVVGNEGNEVYVTPYLHNGSALDINITRSTKGVICNIFTDEPYTKQRISWRGLELTTVKHKDDTLYAIKTETFNTESNQDDRRLHERIVIQKKGQLFDGLTNDGVEVLIHDISDVGVSFYVPSSFETIVNQVSIKFTDNIDDKVFNCVVVCNISRETQKAGNTFMGCKIVDKNKDYQLYGFMKRLKEKNKAKV